MQEYALPCPFVYISTLKTIAVMTDLGIKEILYCYIIPRGRIHVQGTLLYQPAQNTSSILLVFK